MPLTPRLRHVVLVALVGAVVTPLTATHADEDPSCRFPGQVVEQQDGWWRIKAPEYDAGESWPGDPAIQSLAVSSGAAKRLYATNGTVVKRTADNGCDWGKAIWPAADALSRNQATVVDSATAASLDHVVDIQVARRYGGSDTLFVLSADKTNVDKVTGDPAQGAYHPHFWVSTAADAAEVQFVERSDGLPTAGRPLKLLAPTDRNIYLFIDVPAPEASVGVVNGAQQPWSPGIGLYYTATGGTSVSANGVPIASGWQRSPMPPGLTEAPDGIAPIFNIPFGFHMWKGSKLYTTTDFGQHWIVRDAGGTIAAVDTIRAAEPGFPYGHLDLFVNKAGGTSVIRTTRDNGKTFTEQPVPGPVLDATRIYRPDLFVVTTPKGIFGYDTRLKMWIDITPLSADGKGRTRDLTQLDFALSSRPGVLYGHTGTEILRRSLYFPNLFVPIPGPKISKVFVDPVIWVPPSSQLSGPQIVTERPIVAVDPGEVTSVKGQFGMPPDPIPIDVYFLVDTTGSMGPTIEGLKSGIGDIVSALLKQRIDAWFGLGEFKDVGDYPPRHCKTEDQQCIYRRALKVAPIGDGKKFHDALVSLRADGGGAGLNEEPEAQTAALSQAATGLGDKTLNIQPGLDAGFRTKSVKVIMLITDAAFKRGAQYPTINQTVKALVTRDIYVPGIVMLTANDADAAEADVTEVATGTGTVAPPQGVDCDGDRRQDVEGGKPLVCRNSGVGLVNMKDSVVSLLLGIKDPGRAAVEFAGPPGVIKAVHGVTSDTVNFKLENRLTFQLDLTCSKEQEGKTLPIQIVGSRRGEAVASETILVRCNSHDVVEETVIPPFLPPLIVAPAAIVPPPPPVQPPQPIQNPNPNPNINPNAGMANQEEQQFQLAAVGQGGMEQPQEDESTEYAMSALDTRQDTSTLPMLAGAMAMTGMAAGAMTRRRLQRSPARAQARVR